MMLFVPDLVLVQWWTTFWAFAFAWTVRALMARGIRTGYLVHNVIPHETRPWDRSLAKMALRQGDFFIVLSSRQQEMLQQLIPGARSELVEHPVYNFFADQKMNKAEARRKLGIPESLPIVLFFGIVRPYKGLSVLVEAVGQLAAEGEHIGLYIAGEFWEDVQKYRDQIERLKITDRVWIDNRYIPNEDVSIIFSAADVFAAPYTGGTQSGAVRVAMSHGLPVLITDTIVGDLDRGDYPAMRITPGGDSVALAKGIREWLEDPPSGHQGIGHNDWSHIAGVIKTLSFGG
jgi:glycosyltransferase involved in cell wall biosynthesis